FVANEAHAGGDGLPQMQRSRGKRFGKSAPCSPPLGLKPANLASAPAPLALALLPRIWGVKTLLSTLAAQQTAQCPSEREERKITHEPQDQRTDSWQPRCRDRPWGRHARLRRA